ncbi:pre-tRNA nuclear export protein, partial [Rhizophlyctis rosea]
MDPTQSFEQAVRIALDPTADPQLKQQATQYYDQIRLSDDGWAVALRVFLGVSTPEPRFHALSIIEDTLRTTPRYTSLTPDHQSYLRQSLWSYLTSSLTPSSEPTTPTRSPSLLTDPPFLRSKLALTLVLLLKNQYPLTWPTFFTDFTTLLTQSSSSTQTTPSAEWERTTGNVRWETAVDVFLRTCLAIDDEVVRLDLVRSPESAHLNTRIKDAMREGDTALLTQTWFRILSLTHSTSPHLTPTILNLYARYVSWIDISLVVTPEFMNALYSFISNPSTRTSAVECLTEIVGKGMKPADKLGLVQMLGVGGVLEGVRGEVESDPEFGECVAKFVNVLGVEVGRCWEDVDVGAAEIRRGAMEVLDVIFPHFIFLLANEYDDTTRVLFPFLEKWIAIQKRIRKDGGGATGSGGAAEAQVVEVLRVVVGKMKWDEESSWGFAEDGGEAAGGGVGDEEGEFLEMRKQLRTYLDTLSTLHPALFISYTTSYVLDTFTNLRSANGSFAKTWSEAELALMLVYWFSESDVAAYPHPSISYAFFDNVSRYAGFFDVYGEFVGGVLGCFVDGRGLHHPRRAVRSRVYYHFLKFVEKLKTRLVPFVENILSSIQDLLVIPPPTPDMLPQTDSPSGPGTLPYSSSSASLVLAPSGSVGSMEGQTLKMASP